MARELAHFRTPCLCSHQQGSHSAGKRLPPYRRRRAISEAGILAGRIDQAVASCGATDARGEIMKHRILVIEDNPANSELLCDWLEAQGFAPIAAENLDQAFAALRSGPPDAILLD